MYCYTLAVTLISPLYRSTEERSHVEHVRARRPDSTGLCTSLCRRAQKRTRATCALGNIGRPASRDTGEVAPPDCEPSVRT
jgi:hypothetical protein